MCVCVCVCACVRLSVCVCVCMCVVVVVVDPLITILFPFSTCVSEDMTYGEIFWTLCFERLFGLNL